MTRNDDKIGMHEFKLPIGYREDLSLRGIRNKDYDEGEAVKALYEFLGALPHNLVTKLFELVEKEDRLMSSLMRKKDNSE